MDPGTCFQVACGVVQLVDFGFKITAACREIHKNGSFAEVDVIEQSALPLKESLDDLNQSLRTSGSSLSKADKDLHQLGIRCARTSNKLLAEVGQFKITTKGNKKEAIVKTVKLIWKRGKLYDVWRELEAYQKALDTNTLLQLRERFEKLSEQQKQVLKQLNHNTKTLIKAVEAHQQSFEQVISSFNSRNSRRRQDLLDSLSFDGMEARQEQIAEAHKETFEWIFDTSEHSTQRWDNFADWLEGSSEGIYWLNGKAGSGKSTLMNFISDDKRTSSILKSWTGDRKLVCPKFFFWSPGSSLMKSFTGLLRALLYQILSQYQELQPLIYEQVIASLPFGDQQNEFSPKWKPGKLRDCLHTLLNQQQIPLKFCFFIDGLDEFEGERTDLLQFALDTASFPGVKMCLSSRPWPVFHKALDNFPKLALQDLTWKDIKMYVTDKMNSGLLLHGTDTLNAEHAQSLIDEIVFKANGVFLWVKLAVQSLLAGLEGEDCFPELRARLERTPPEVDDLYRHMLSQIDTSHRTQALRLFRLTLEADPPDKNFLEIALAYRLWASNCQWDLSELSTTVGEAIRDCELLLKHIPARTAGLLEIIPGRRSDDDSGYSTSNTSSDSDDSEEHADSKPAAGTNGLGNFKKMQVEFLHRILYDFISKELDHLEDVEPTKFDVVSALQVIILAYVTLKQLSYTCETWGNGLCLIGQSSFTEGFVTHALKLKTQTGEVPENLLDLFCQTAPDKEDDLCRPRYLNEACAVLVLAEYGLTCYVRKKLESWPFNSNQSLRIALLYHLVDGLVRDVVNPSGMPGIVRRLFEQDSDPNALDSEAQQMRLGFKKKAPHQSPWNILLSRIAGAYEIGTDDVTVASHSAILQLFIGAHANPNESVGLKISLFGVNNKRIQVHMDCSALNIFSSVQGRYRPSAAVMRALCYSGGRNERVYTSVSCGKDDYRLNQREDNYRLDQGESQLLVALIDGMRPPYIEYRESFQREGLELFSVGSGFRVEGEDFEGEDELTKFSYEVANILHNRKPEKYPAPKLEDGNLSIPGAEIEESSAS